jgi:hypothetical protein
MTEKGVSLNSDTVGTPDSVSLPLALPRCECICHENGGEPFSCGGMCWHPWLDANSYTIELASSTNNVDHSVSLFAVYSGGRLSYLLFDPSNGPVMRFEVV